MVGPDVEEARGRARAVFLRSRGFLIVIAVWALLTGLVVVLRDHHQDGSAVVEAPE